MYNGLQGSDSRFFLLGSIQIYSKLMTILHIELASKEVN